ncbi:MAG: hypothetical protein ACLQU1_12830 [Bryobacteraceae bacterium]
MRLSSAFDELFSTVTGYDALDQRIAKTKANKGPLLMVLGHPEIPLHNNPAELGDRGRDKTARPAQRSDLHRHGIHSICRGLSVARLYCVTLGHGGRLTQWPRPLASYAKWRAKFCAK